MVLPVFATSLKNNAQPSGALGTLDKTDPNTLSVIPSEFPKVSIVGEDRWDEIPPVDASGVGDGAGVQQPQPATSPDELRSVAFSGIGAANIADIAIAEQAIRALASQQKDEVLPRENGMPLRGTQSFADNNRTEAAFAPELQLPDWVRACGTRTG